ncbi:hypothetical protein EDD27_7804 [Nonomuraea polychroma]|uniref:Uncharacterized protein n=1 Tax=Nonomuraea polychroma TaxID=46176 RepID=A0A438MHI4_9ACTN|nr:hypothetical protein [Nonomuraea polychroma]RVX45028.1 hypothetical protein EDD27_7804 [Nonomuraea polychroma]
MKTPKSSRRRPSLNRLLLAAVVAWIAVLTVIILLDPRGAGPAP